MKLISSLITALMMAMGFIWGYCFMEGIEVEAFLNRALEQLAK